jgi:hypothetical protein
MDEQVLNDLYRRAVSLGYKKTKSEFVNLLKTDNSVFKDNYSYVRSKGYKKGENDFSVLIGKSAQQQVGKPAPGSAPGPSGGLRLPSNLTGSQIRNLVNSGKYKELSSVQGLISGMNNADLEAAASQISGKSPDEAARYFSTTAQLPARTWRSGLEKVGEPMRAAAPVQTQAQMAPQAAQPRSQAGERVLRGAVQSGNVVEGEMGGRFKPLSPEELDAQMRGEAMPKSSTIVPVEVKREEGKKQAVYKSVNSMSKQQMSNVLNKAAQRAEEEDDDELNLGPYGAYKLGDEPEAIATKRDRALNLDNDFTQEIASEIKKRNVRDSEDKIVENLSNYFNTYEQIKATNDESFNRMATYQEQYQQALNDPSVSDAQLEELKTKINEELSIQEMLGLVEDYKYGILPAEVKSSLASVRSSLQGQKILNSIENSATRAMVQMGNAILSPFLNDEQLKASEFFWTLPVQSEKEYIEKQIQDLPYARIANKSILDDLNILNVTSTTTQVGGSMAAMIAGSVVGGPVGGFAAGASMIYGDSYDEARKAGFDETESTVFAGINAGISGALERVGFKGITRTLATDAEKRYILSAIRSEIKKGAKPNDIIKNITERVGNSFRSYLQGGLPEGFTEVAQGGSELVLKSAFNSLALEEGQKGFETPTLDEAAKMLLEQFIVGKVSGGVLPATISAFSSPNIKYEQAAKSVVKGQRSLSKTIETTKALISTGKITRAEGLAFLENLKIADAAKASLPKYITSKEQRVKAISLIMERNRLNKEIENSDPDLKDGYMKRLDEIKQELKSIADKKWKAPVNPVITTSIAGFETATEALASDTDQDNSARVFNATVSTSDNGLLSKVMKSMEAGKEISSTLLDKMANSLNGFIQKLEAVPSKTPEIQKALASAKDIVQKLTSYTVKVDSETNGTIPSLNMATAMARIEAGVEVGDIDFMENTPDEIAMLFSDIMDGKDVSEADAKTVADFLYDRYSKLIELRDNIKKKLNNATGEKQISKYENAIAGINEVLGVLDSDINTAVKYQQEKALQDEVAGVRERGPLGAEPETEAEAGAESEAESKTPPPVEILVAEEYDSANQTELEDRFEAQFGEPIQRALIKAINSVSKLIAKIAPDVKFYVHISTNDFINALRDEGVKKGDRSDGELKTSGGLFVMDSKGKARSIHINLEYANTKSTDKVAKVVYHEAAHLILNKYFKSSERVVADMVAAIRSAVPEGISSEIDGFLKAYKNDPDETKREEYLAELVDILANNETELSNSVISNVIKAINDVIIKAAEALNISNVERFLINDDRADFIEFINSTAMAVRSGLESDISKRATQKIQKKYAVQEQAAGEVPVQSRTRASKSMEGGKPEAGPEKTSKQGELSKEKKFTEGFSGQEAVAALAARAELAKAKTELDKDNTSKAYDILNSIKSIFATAKNIIVESNRTLSKYEGISQIFPRTELQQGDVVLDTGAAKESVYGRNESNKAYGGRGFKQRTDLTANETNRTILGRSVIVKAVFDTSKSIKDRILEINNGKATVDDSYLEITGSNEAFHALISKGRSNQGPSGQSVLIRPKDAYKDMRLFISEDGTSGFALTKDNRLISVWNDAKNGKPKRLPQIMYLAIQEGASKLECFDIGLVQLYQDFGFRPVGRFLFREFKTPTPWVDEYGNKQSGWEYAGEPDIVYMVYDGGDRNNIAFITNDKGQKRIIPWVSKDKISDVQENIATGNPVVIQNNDPRETGVKTKASKGSAIKENELFQINAAPLFRTKITQFRQAASLHLSMVHKEFKEEFKRIAEDFNVEVVNVIDSIGGFDGESEVSAVFNVKGAWEDVVRVASFIGILAPEVQESTIAAQVVKSGSSDHNADRIQLKVDNSEVAFISLKEVGFENEGYTIFDDTIWLLDFSKGKNNEFDNRLYNLEKTIEQYGGKIISKSKSAIKSEYIDDKGSFDGTNRNDVIRNFEKNSVQRRRDRGYVRNVLEEVKERLKAFKEYKRIKRSVLVPELMRLRQKQLDLAAEGEMLPVKENNILNKYSAIAADRLSKVIAREKNRYEEAKVLIEGIASDVLSAINDGFVSKFGIKRASRAAEKVIRWYKIEPTLLGDGARTNIIVNTDTDAEFLFEEIIRRYPHDTPRVEKPEKGTELGYPKRLIEIRTKNGKIAEIQVMTPQGYLAKDGAKSFPENQIKFAKEHLSQIRENLGWNIPDGVGHYFYEIHRDPNVPLSIRKQAEVISKKYYNAMLNSEYSQLTDNEFRSEISDFKNKVDSADKRRWDKSNKGISPVELDQYLGLEEKAKEAPKLITKASKSAQTESMGYDPNQAADRGNNNDRKLQQDIFDAANAIWETLKGLDSIDQIAYLYDEVLKNTGIELNPVQTAELIKDIKIGKRPEYKKDQSGKFRREGTRTDKSAVLTRVLAALDQLATDRRVNKSIISALKNAIKGGPQYTVENQLDAEAIRDTIFDAFDGVSSITAAEQLYDIAQTTTGGLKSSMLARLANDAWNKAREAKTQEERTEYRNLGQRAMIQLADEATEAGRFNAMIYRIQKLNPEFIIQLEIQKIRSRTSQQMTNPGKKKRRVQSFAVSVNKSQTDTAQQAAAAPSVQSAISTATGAAPTTSTPPTQKAPKQKSQQPKAANKTQDQQIDDRIKDLKKKLANKFGGLKTKAARSLPAGIDAETLDIITELARNYIQKGYTDKTALLAKISSDVAAAGGSLTIDYYNQMWVEVSAEAYAQSNKNNAESLANRIVGRVKQEVNPNPKTLDPIAELLDALFKKATEDLPDLVKAKMSSLDKLIRLMENFDRAKATWEYSKGIVEAKIDALDPLKFSPADKQRMIDTLDSFFANDLSPFEIKGTPYSVSEKSVSNTIKDQMNEKKMKIEEILLLANTKQAATKQEFIDAIVHDIVAATGISNFHATKIAEAFADKYDTIISDKQESLLKRFLPKHKNVSTFKRKSTAQRAFEMIKYGALDPSITVYDKDGNIVDTAMLLAQMFNIPYVDENLKDSLNVYAEAIAETPVGVLRHQVMNDMMMFIKMYEYKYQGSFGDRFMSTVYANMLTSMDTMLKAFNSNVLMYNIEFVSQAVRATAKGDFSLIPMLVRGYYQKKGVGFISTKTADKAMVDVDGYVINNGDEYYVVGDKKVIMSMANPKAASLSGHYEGLLRYSISINSAKAVLRNVALYENFTNNITAMVYEKHAKTKAGKVWGKYATLAQKGLGSLDALTTAAATKARFSDLLYDAIKTTSAKLGEKMTGRQIADAVNMIQGYDAMVQLDALNQAISEMEEQQGGPVDLSVAKNKVLMIARMDEIVAEKMTDRFQNLVATYPWLSALDQSEIADMLDQSREIASKIGLMGTPPGVGGILSHLLGLPGKTIRYSNVQYGAFTNAPVNAALYIIQGNTPIGALVTLVRLLKSKRGLSLGSEALEEFYKRQGIRTEMYGQPRSEVQITKNTSFQWNLEKEDLLTKFLLVQAPVMTMTYMGASAIIAGLAGTYDDDDEDEKRKKELLIRDGVEFLRTIPQKEREMVFFGDKLAKEGSARYDGVWKNLPLYVTSSMYGYSGGGYAKMQSLKSRFGIEPYCVYSYGKKIFSYKDNPVLGAYFMQMGATNDALLFNETTDMEDTQLGVIMMSALTQMNLIRDQSNIRSIAEITEFFAGQKAYEGMESYKQRAELYLSKTAGNIVNTAVMPAEMKNLNQDIMAITGQYMDDPKSFMEFAVYRWPVVSSILIDKEKTGPFGYPLPTTAKRVFPIGTEQYKLPIMIDGSLNIPTVDNLLSTEDAKYLSLFERNKSDKFAKMDISSYYKLDKYGNYEKKSFTREQVDAMREEYKLVMREFAEKNIDVNVPAMFDVNLKVFLSTYGMDKGLGTMGYKRYILNKVFGKEAKNMIIDQADALINLQNMGLTNQQIERLMESFEEIPEE